jgi:porin
MTAYPQATWGIRTRIQFEKQWYAMASVLNGDPTLGENHKHGLDWSMRGPYFAIGEIGYQYNQGTHAAGLPGNYKIGAYYDNGIFTDFLHDINGGLAPLTGLTYRTTRGSSGFYVLVDQMIYRRGDTQSQQGLTSFASFLAAPDQSINMMPLFINGGLVYRGLIPNRESDVAGLGIIYGKISNKLREAEHLLQQMGTPASSQYFEMVTELTYSIQVAHWLQVQPDVQYIIKPGATGTIPNALVLGFQLTINFI